jgi:hypothetical protein
MVEKKYIKVLVSRFTSANGCNVADGIILTIVPKKEIKQKGQVSHYFVSTGDRKAKSKYGWVKSVSPFTLAEFISNYRINLNDLKEVGSVEVMLNSIENLIDGCPVAVTYSERGFEKKEMVLTVHKVFFYDK